MKVWIVTYKHEWGCPHVFNHVFARKRLAEKALREYVKNLFFFGPDESEEEILEYLEQYTIEQIDVVRKDESLGYIS